MDQFLYLVVLALSLTLLGFVQGGAFSVGSCPPIETQVDLQAIHGSWYSMIETESTGNCTSYEITDCTQMVIGVQCVFRKTSLVQSGVYDFEDGMLYHRQRWPKFIWPGTFELRRANVYVYNDNLVGLFFCRNRGVVREQKVVILSRTKEFDSLGVAKLAKSLDKLKIGSDDLNFVNQDSCPAVPVTTTTEAPVTSPTDEERSNVYRFPPTTPEPPYPEFGAVPENPSKGIHISWLAGPGITVVPVPTTTQRPVTTTSTTEATTSRAPTTTSTKWVPVTDVEIDIPWLAEPGVSRMPPSNATTTEAQPPTTTNSSTAHPTATTTTTEAPPPVVQTPTTPEWTTIGVTDPISYDTEPKSEEAN